MTRLSRFLLWMLSKRPDVGEITLTMTVEDSGIETISPVHLSDEAIDAAFMAAFSDPVKPPVFYSEFETIDELKNHLGIATRLNRCLKLGEG